MEESKTYRNSIKYIHILLIALFLSGKGVFAQYKETIHKYSSEKNLIKDFGMQNDNAKKDQSIKLQNAIDKISKQGGGKLYLPKGVYRFSKIYMNSNVHLLVDKGVVIKPFWGVNGGAGDVFYFTNQSDQRRGEEGFIENVSLRCKQKGEYFTIDYSNIEKNRHKTKTAPARAFKCTQVRNFLIEGLFVIDNWTRFCAGIFVPSTVKGSENWEVSKPINGVVRNFKSIDSSPGYGLAQLHGGYNLHFENLATTNGGVTFRLETGGGGPRAGIDKISAENIYCENGATPVIMGPHTAKNGMVKIKNIKAVSCYSAFQCGPGFLDGKFGKTELGRFADGCLIENIHAEYGEKAYVHFKNLGELTEEQLSKLWFDKKSEILRGPSPRIAIDRSADSWSPIIKNVSSKGFKSDVPKIDTSAKPKRKSYQQVLKNYPVWDQLPQFLKEPIKKKGKKKKGTKKSKKKKKH